MTSDWKHYGKEAPDLETAPEYTSLPSMEAANLYQPGDELAAAVNVAVKLGMPLLVTGKPGCGKTQLAWHLAYKFGKQEPLIFDAKTTSTAQDLFYRYDALRHFQAASVRRAEAVAAVAAGQSPVAAVPSEDAQRRETMQYIELQALGIASLLASDDPAVRGYLPPRYQTLGSRRSVVLIDEIDKAPRDLPNDILREIETLSFTIRETGERLPPRGIAPRYRPIVILTSNSEKSLPDAFLRRCVFFHIPRPKQENLRKIVTLRLTGGEKPGFPAELVDEAVALFDKIRVEAKLRKEPSTAELLQWARMLGASGKTPKDVIARDAEALRITYVVMGTEEADEARIRTSVSGK
jgi:MoxR-like ATPase